MEKLCGIAKNPEYPKQSWKRTKLESSHFQISKFTTKATVVKAVCVALASLEQKKGSRSKAIHLWSITFTTGAKTIQWGKKNLLNCSGTAG